ncbi:MAG: hypothetical protein IJY09_06385 [Lachnospiraceae bacterium]|nr:hypothetical protein [Lachnospiraceae bacterium]
MKEAYPEYVTDFPTQLKQLTYYLTPFYYDADAAEYHYGNTSRITQNVSSALADYSGDEWDDNDDGYLVEDDDPLSTGNVLNFFNNIGESIKTVINWFKDVINDAFRLISYVGQVPALLSSFMPFIPEELWSLIGIGLFLYFAPALLAGIRNLLKLGG